FRRTQKDAWEYNCAHSGTTHEGEPSVNMAAWKLDGAVWWLAVNAIRDENFLLELIADTDASTVSPAVRVASLKARLAEAEQEHARLMKHFRRLDPDEPDDQGLIADIEADLKLNRERRAEVAESIAAVEAEVQNEEARKARLEAFRAYAQQEAPTLAD